MNQESGVLRRSLPRAESRGSGQVRNQGKLKTIIHNSLFMIPLRGGFTIIELLVVISIIAILTAFLVANFIGVKQRARDGQRKSDLRNIQAALEIYRSDSGKYPDSIPACSSIWQDPSGAIYMQTVPCDPLNTGQYIYSYTSVSGTYSLVGCLENTKDSQKDSVNDDLKCDGGNTNWSLTLKNP